MGCAPENAGGGWRAGEDPLLSIVVPVLNEQAILPQLCRRIDDALSKQRMKYELIFVNDGSSDGSLQVLLNLRSEYSAVRVVDFSRNFGQQIALAAGLDYARGDAVITMDADLQHPPELIPELVRKWREGYDVVYTVRKSTAGVGAWKNWTSRLFYSLINRLAEVDVPPGAADFRILDRRVVEVFRTLTERALFLRGMVGWVGFRQTSVPFEAGARPGAESKYSAWRLLRFAADGITSFSSLPLYVAALLGLTAAAFGFAYAAYAVYARLFTDRTIEGWTSVLVAVLFLGGIQLIALGIQGAYLGRIYNEVKGRPRYLVRRTYGFDGS